MNTLDIGLQFSRYPAGRYASEGRHSGEEFREKFLRPALAQGQQLRIFLDNTRGYGSSFLEEAFGGLVRLGYSPSEVIKSIHFDTYDDSLKEEIIEYINHAK